MAGKPQKGLKFAGWSVNIFDGDTKIDKLLEAQGWIGFSIYFYLCQMAYKFDEYFYRWSYDDSVTTARRMGGGVKSETVRQTVRLCLQIGLFDKGLFDRDGILTSRGIQRRFYNAIQTRRRKIVIADYWLLDDEESKGLEMCSANADSHLANNDLRPTDSELRPADETKVKNSKVKESKVLAPPDGGWGFGPELNNVFSEWLAYKKEKRQPYEATGLNNLMAIVQSQKKIYGEKAVVDLIRLCMANNWHSIAWDRLGKMAPPSPPSNGRVADSARADIDRMEKFLKEIREVKHNGEPDI